jgi:hypothetical protein
MIRPAHEYENSKPCVRALATYDVALVLLLIALTAPGTARAAPPIYAATLVRCSDAAAAGAVVSVGCAGDSLTSGNIGISSRSGRVMVSLKGASQVRPAARARAAGGGCPRGSRPHGCDTSCCPAGGCFLNERCAPQILLPGPQPTCPSGPQPACPCRRASAPP